MNCSPAVMYSVCKPDISESSKSEPVYALLPIISSEYTQQRIWNLHTACSYSLLSECPLGVHLMLSVLLLTVSVHHQHPQQVMDFRLFFLVIYMENTTQKTPWQPQYVHCYGSMLIADNVTIPHLHDFRLWTWCERDLRFWNFTQLRLVVSFWCWRFKSWDV